MYNIALFGYPNAGKTSVFNVLTNNNKKTANLAGVTVDSFEGFINIENQQYKITDLPGINSLSYFSNSKDEIVVNKYIKDNPNDIYLNVVNISQLKRHLLLSLNAIYNNLNVVLVVNMVDTVLATDEKLTKIQSILQENLNIPVVLTSAKKKLGINEIHQAIIKAQNKKESKKIIQDNKEIPSIVNRICEKIGELDTKSKRITKKLDNTLLHYILGIPFFFLIIYTILFITMNMHIIFSGIIDDLGGIFFIEIPSKVFELVKVPEIITLIVAQGIGSGIQTVLTFIPIIFTLFFLLSMLEQSGYMARAAFIADSTMQRIGLPGKAFVSLIMGLGCTAACATGCRTLERESDRKLSLMLSPSVSCSAKLAVYIYLGFIFFGDNATNVVFLMYVIGILFLVINGIFLSKSLFSSNSLPFIIELPDYRMPSLKLGVSNAYTRVKNFILGLGKTIVPIIAFLTIANTITFQGEINPKNKQETVLAVVSQKATPLLKPIGITEENWQATLGLITGIFAKEVLVATLDYLYFPIVEEESEGIIEGIKNAFIDFIPPVIARNYFDLFEIEGAIDEIKEEDIGSKRDILLNSFGSNIAVFSFLLFVLLYTPCVSAMGAISKEIGKKWALLVALWSFFNAYMVSFLYYQLASNFLGLYSFLVIVFFIITYSIIFFIFRYYGKKYQEKWQHNFIFSKNSVN